MKAVVGVLISLSFLIFAAYRLGTGQSAMASGRHGDAGSSVASTKATASPTKTSVARTTGVSATEPVQVPDGALVKQYCFTCHSDKVKTAGLSLESVNFGDVGKNADTLEKVVKKLRTGAMPPPGMPRPDKVREAAFVSSLESALDTNADHHPDAGRPMVRRLNRTEYTNAIRDLLALDVDGPSLLPPDPADLGFDNIGTSLTISPALFDRYLTAARQISRMAVGTSAPPVTAVTFAVPAEMFQDERMSDDLPFGTRGGEAVKYTFPADGTYSVKVRLRRDFYTYIRGLEEPQQIDVRLDGHRVGVFEVGGHNEGEPPASYAGETFGSPTWEQYALHADDQFVVSFPAKAGPHNVGASFVDRPSEVEGVVQPPLLGFGYGANNSMNNPATGRYAAWLDSMVITGPQHPDGAGDSASRRQVFVCRPSPADNGDLCAKKILSRLARLAYRRPATEAEVATLLGFYRNGRSKGFDNGIASALERMLVDPSFLFHIERDPSVGVAADYRLSDFEVASRLSFLLWSSIPDERLLDLAAAGKLQQDAILTAEVRRMLADPRASALVDNFAGQWLELRNIESVKPDPDQFYTEFNENLRHEFEQETKLFIGSQIREDASVLDLVRAKYTFVNEHLADFYGIKGVSGERFRRVELPDDRRGGLLGQGSVLTVTSYANRTSPVLRGKWILENVLGTPPPPPPPNVPALPDNGANGGQLLSMRDRMAQHRNSPVCSSCHSRMDPLGFALENFDAVGQWRSADDSGQQIDASASLPDGTKFDGLPGLKAFILAHPEQFTDTLTEKLMTFALGREIEYYDMPAVRRVLRSAAPSDYRWSSIITSIVESRPFEFRHEEGEGQ